MSQQPDLSLYYAPPFALKMLLLLMLIILFPRLASLGG